MQKKYELPTGYISVEDAVKLIKDYDGSVSQTVPFLDITGMVSRHRWIEPAHTFRIRYVTLGKDKLGRPTEISQKSIWTFVMDDYEAELLKHALADKYRELAHQEFNMQNVKKVATTYDDQEGNSVKPRINKHSNTTAGDEISAQTRTVTGGNV